MNGAPPPPGSGSGSPPRAQRRAAGLYLLLFALPVCVLAWMRGAGRVVIPLVAAIAVGVAIARWVRAQWRAGE